MFNGELKEKVERLERDVESLHKRLKILEDPEYAAKLRVDKLTRMLDPYSGVHYVSSPTRRAAIAQEIADYYKQISETLEGMEW